jgi:tRNA G18 (ribose-2'-O)-methylase SpoU
MLCLVARMPLIYLDQLSDPRLEPYRQLPSARYEQRQGWCIAEGHWLVERLWRSGHELMSVLIAEDRLTDLPEGVVESTPVLVVRKAELNDIIGYDFHRGMIGCGRRPPLLPVETWVAALPRDRASILVADQIVDPENMGGLLRVASALGVDGVLLGPGCADPYSRRVLRVSMGNVFHLPLTLAVDLPSALHILHESWGFQVVATVLDPHADHLHAVPRPARLALVVGSEGHGISPAVLAACDRRVTLPMQHGTDSLNVTTAAAIFWYEFNCRKPDA